MNSYDKLKNDMPEYMKSSFHYHIINKDAYNYPINTINKLKYKPDTIVSNKYFCELTRNNWLSHKNTPTAIEGYIGIRIIHIDNTNIFPININHIHRITDIVENKIEIDNIELVDPTDYLIYKGFR